MSTKSTSEAHRRFRQRQKVRRQAEPDTSETCREAGQRGGRAPKPGEKNSNAKLTRDQVDKIRDRRRKLVEALAAEYGLSEGYVEAIWRRAYWK